MLNSLDLFSGYGGITLALENYAKPIMYCEIEKYAQGILLSRMDDGAIPFAPIWNDVTTLDGTKLRGMVDIVYGGFPCQDISIAGKGVGLGGKRSGLFFEIIRICQEASPKFIFLENVPAIRTRGAIEVQEALANIGYASRWHHLSAAQVGARHKRERWFLLAYADSSAVRLKSGRSRWESRKEKTESGIDVEDGNNTNPDCFSKELRQSKEREQDPFGLWRLEGDNWNDYASFLLGMDHGCTFRSHRVKAMGNGVVPLQAKKAFEYLLKGM